MSESLVSCKRRMSAFSCSRYEMSPFFKQESNETILNDAILSVFGKMDNKMGSSSEILIVLVGDIRMVGDNARFGIALVFV